jgi:hypothetical protein
MRKVCVAVMVVVALACVAGVASAQVSGGVNPLSTMRTR